MLMKPRTALGLVFVLLVAASVITWGVFRARSPRAAQSDIGAPAAAEQGPFTPLRLDVEVNGGVSAVVTPDTPIVVAVKVVNVAARDTAALRAARIRTRDDVQRQVREKLVTPDQAQWLLANADVPPAAADYLLAIGQEQFAFADPNGKSIALPWKLALTTPPAEVRVDDRTDAEVTMIAAPSSSPAPLAQDYRFVVSYNNTSAVGGRWTGQLRSEPLTITVKPSLDRAEERAGRAQAFAEYHLLNKDMAKVETAVEELLREAPGSVRGLYLRGVALETRGDFRGALRAYQEAIGNARRWAPSTAPPYGLDDAVARMLERNGVDMNVVIR